MERPPNGGASFFRLTGMDYVCEWSHKDATKTRKGTVMGLVTRYKTQEEIPEEVREDFVEDTVSEKNKGTWVHKDIFALEKSLGMERNDHKAAKANIAQLTDQLNGANGELEALHQLGTLDELKELRAKADAALPPPKLEELRTQLAATTQQLREAQDWRKNNEARLKQLEEAEAKHAREKDQADARTTIAAAVKNIQGVNADALTDSLYFQYLAGVLKRSEIGEIVAADGTTVADFATRYAKEHGLVLQSVGGGQKPPQNLPRGSKAALQAAYDEAKKSGNTAEMLRIKTELGKIQ